MRRLKKIAINSIDIPIDPAAGWLAGVFTRLYTTLRAYTVTYAASAKSRIEIVFEISIYIADRCEGLIRIHTYIYIYIPIRAFPQSMLKGKLCQDIVTVRPITKYREREKKDLYTSERLSFAR